MLSEIKRLLYLEQSEREKSVLTYPAHDYVEYMRRVGEHGGLTIALQIIASVEKQQEFDPDA